MLTLAGRIKHALIGVGGSAARVTGLGQMQVTHKGDLTTAGTRGVTAFFTLGCWCSFGHGCIQREVDGERFLLV